MAANTYLITIARIERAGSAGQVGPFWNIVDTDGNGYTTIKGAQCNFNIGNPGMREGDHVMITQTSANSGKIRTMRPAVIARLDQRNGSDVYTFNGDETTSSPALWGFVRAVQGNNPVLLLVDTRYATSPTVHTSAETEPKVLFSTVPGDDLYGRPKGLMSDSVHDAVLAKVMVS